MSPSDLADKSIAALWRLDGRQAAITGGAHGLGLAMARRLGEAGATIAIGDLDAAAAESACAALRRDFGIAATAHSLDVRDGASMTAFAARAELAGGPIDIWINNAGIYPIHAITEMTEEAWDLVSDVNLRGCFLGAREAARRMRAAPGRPGQVILNVASVSGVRGRAGLAHYTATKHGVIGLTKSLALELGPHGIRALAIAPTMAATPGMDARRAETGDAAALEARLAAQLPLGRIATADDVARVALFCVSDMAALMTGTTVFVDAGATAG